MVKVIKLPETIAKIKEVKIMHQTFAPYTGPMDFPSILSQISEQKIAAELLSELAQNGEITDEEALVKIGEINKASSSLRAVVAVFTEMHKDSSLTERKTLSDAIETLDVISGKFRASQRLN